ncbi:universal stress protein [Geodermatophilus sp. SYSU D00703]
MTRARRSDGGPEEHASTGPRAEDPRLAAVPDHGDGRRVEPLRLTPLLPRRQNPWLVVDVDGTPAGYGALVWALREAARREATVVAVCVLDEDDVDPLRRSSRRDRTVVEERLEAQVLRAIAETGVVGRARTTVLERPVFEALTGAARGADLVVVGAHGKTLLRPAVPRPHLRRVARGA